MAERKINHEAQLALDQPLLKVPSELLQKSLRTTRKNLERDFTLISNQLSAATIDQCIARAETLKRKLEESAAEEQLITKRLKSRTDHLVQLHSFEHSDQPEFVDWSKLRVNRLLIDYILRNGHHASAKSVAAAVPGLNELVDVELFESAWSIEKSLTGRSCVECLQWCHENRAALKKIKSPLEFMLRVQEYVELLKSSTPETAAKNRIDAIVYAKKYFQPFSDQFLPQIQKALALLVFPFGKTKVNAYKDLLSDDRWNAIMKQFRSDAYQLYSLPSQSLLSLALQAGLSSLKTHGCYKDSDKNVNCPVCTQPFNKLAKKLPFSHHMNSTIVCRISGLVMDENNPPMILPNGNAYSLQALTEMANENNGFIIDPRSGHKFTFTQCKKAFVA